MSGYYDNLPMADFQRKALEAGREKFPNLVKSDSGCSTEFDAMLKAYETAADLAFSGTEAEWIQAMDDATAAHGAWASCFYHPEGVDVVLPA